MAAAEADPFVSTTAPTVVLANAPATGSTPSRPAASRDGAKPLCFSPATPGRPAAQGLGLMYPSSTPAPMPTTNIVPMGTTTALMPASGAAATTPASAGKPSPTASVAGTPLTVASTTSPRPTKTKRRSRPRPRATGNGEWNTGKWSKDEDAALRHGVSVVGARQWKRISVEFLHNQRSDVQCLHRWQKVLRPGLVKGSWEKEEDETIVRCIQNGIVKWSEIAAHIPGRLGKQCRERWFNHLDPTIKKGGWTSDEDAILEQAQAALGNRWCKIAELLPGRTENAVKNRWHSAKRRQAHAARLASRADAAAAARRNGTPLPPPVKLVIPSSPRRKSKSHVPTPEAALEAARRCGLNVGAVPLVRSRAAAASDMMGLATVATNAIASQRSPTRSAPAQRSFITPARLSLPRGQPEVVAPSAARDMDFGLLQLINAIDTQEPRPASTSSTRCAQRVTAPGRVAVDAGSSFVHEPPVHAPVSPVSDESCAAEALQAMHCSLPDAVGRCTPSPPLKLALNKTVDVPEADVSYTLLSPARLATGGDSGVSTFIVRVSPRAATAAAFKRSRLDAGDATEPAPRASKRQRVRTRRG